MHIIELENIKREFRDNPLVRRIVELHNVIVPYDNKCKFCIERDHDTCVGYYKDNCKIQKVKNALYTDLSELRKQYCEKYGLETQYEIDENLTYFVNKEDHFPSAEELRESSTKYTDDYVHYIIVDIYERINDKIKKGANTVMFECKDKNIINKLTEFLDKKGFNIKYLESSNELAISWAAEGEEETL